MKKKGRVDEEEWRAKDRLRSWIIVGLGALAAAAITAVLYFV